MTAQRQSPDPFSFAYAPFGAGAQWLKVTQSNFFK
jgi:hypothetical protein